MELSDLLGKHEGQSALVVAGGPSGATWRDYPADVVIAVNGAIQGCPEPDYWLGAEIDQRPEWMFTQTSAQRIVHMHTWKRVFDKDPAMIPVWKSTQEDHPRRFRKGLWLGVPVKPFADPQLGTSTLMAMHLAGLMGCREVRTVGFDLCFKDGAEQHWYPERRYGVEHWEEWQCAFVEVEGLKTLRYWHDTAKYLKQVQKTWADQGFYWYDSSDGLLQALGIISNDLDTRPVQFNPPAG